MTKKAQILIVLCASLALCGSLLFPSSTSAAVSAAFNEYRLIDLSPSGVNGVLSYNKKTGRASVIRILKDGSGAEQTWQGNLGPKWTNFVALRHRSKAYLLIYDLHSGNAKHLSLATDGGGVIPLRDLSWSSDWNILQYFQDSDNDYLLQYNKHNGYTRIGAVDPNTSKTNNLYSEAWKKDRTAIMPMPINDNIYLFLFNHNDGKGSVTKLSNIGKNTSTEGLWWGFWANEASEFFVFKYQGITYLSRYKPQSKTLQIMHYSVTTKEMLKDSTKSLGDINGAATVTVIGDTPYWITLDKNMLSINRIDPTLDTMSETWNGQINAQKSVQN